MLTTAERIKQIILAHHDIRGIDKSKVTESAHFRNTLGCDDLILLDLSFEIEDEFNILFDQNSFEFDTVGDLIAVVEQKLTDKLPRAAVA